MSSSKVKQRSRVLPGFLLCAFLLFFAYLLLHQSASEAQPPAKPLPGIVVSAKTPIDLFDFMPLDPKEADLHSGNLILVNNETPFEKDRPPDAAVYDFKTENYKVKDKQVLLQAALAQDLNAMLDAYAAESGCKDVIVLSGYRSFDYQAELFRRKEQAVGKQEALRAVALPGRSEHHTGLAIDLSVYLDGGQSLEFNAHGKQQWLLDHASRFGFIVRYTKEKEPITKIMDEPWHFRYVGAPHAAIMSAKNLCLEEYIDYLKQFSYGQTHLTADGYELYFVPDSEASVPIPKDRDYTLSGNNQDGWIVTVLPN